MAPHGRGSGHATRPTMGGNPSPRDRASIRLDDRGGDRTGTGEPPARRGLPGQLDDSSRHAVPDEDPRGPRRPTGATRMATRLDCDGHDGNRPETILDEISGVVRQNP